jgi:serine/threonine protein kinase
LRPICHALGAAHGAGVVHRDIKPENVFIVSTKSAGGETGVKVLDFGIAKIAAQMRTAHTGVIGTPLWMAPEQTDPSAEAGPPADVWAIGLLTFWMLTGRHYWRAAAVPSSSMHALMREILFEPMPTSRERAAQLGVGGRIPPGFDAWFARAAAREPAARFPDANEAFRALEPVLAGTLASEAQTSPPPPQQALHPISVPTLPAARSNPARSRIWLVAIPVLGFGVIGLAAAGLGAAYMTGAFDQATSVAPPVVAPPIPASAASTAPSSPDTPAPPSETQATKPAAGTSKPAVVAPKPSGSPPPAQTAAAPKAFDSAAAQKELAHRAGLAKLGCSSRAGPRAFSSTVSFRNDGTVQNVSMSPQDMATGSGICVFGTLRGARIPAYDGPIQSSGVGVVLNN